MPPSRRKLIRTSIAAGALAGLAGADASAQPQISKPAEHSLDILVLGGTSFLGPAVVEEALARGHGVVLFNRGRTNPEMFGDLEQLRGNRDPDKDEGLAALEGRTFDAVVDTSGHFPRLVRASAELLADSVRQYVYISSISVYPDLSIIGIDESTPVATMEDPTLETFGDQFQYYGPLKALCEQAAESAMPGRATIIRPGLIVGERDNAPRFTYWPVRVERGGEVLAPGVPNEPVQYIDVRDLADFVITCIEDGTTGVFNATGPTAAPTTMAELLYGCKAVIGGDVTFTWVPADFLLARELRPWSDLPVWVPATGESAGLHRVDCSKAIAAGLRTRPLAETVRATLDWYHAWPADKPFRWGGGLSPEREAEVLTAWHEHEKAQATAP